MTNRRKGAPLSVLESSKGHFNLQGPVPVSGHCRFCDEDFTKLAPRSVKNPDCCAKEKCQHARKKENSDKWNRKKARLRNANRN
jgi:hypothetical protein